jgi:hypothetical protein
MDDVQLPDVTYNDMDLARQANDGVVKDLGYRVEKEAADLKRIKGFLADCAALKDTFYGAIGPLIPEWRERGLDSNFYEFNDTRPDNAIELRVSFSYPFHEMVDLLHNDRPLDRDYAPFLTYAVEMARDSGAVVVKHREIKPKVRTPYLAGSPKQVALDAEVVKKDLEAITAARDCARVAVAQLTAAVQKYCADRGFQMVDRPVEISKK